MVTGMDVTDLEEEVNGGTLMVLIDDLSINFVPHSLDMRSFFEYNDFHSFLEYTNWLILKITAKSFCYLYENVVYLYSFCLIIGSI